VGFEVWICTECEFVSNAEPEGSVGTAHAHAERHAPGKLLGFNLPTTWWPTSDPKILNQFIEKVEVKEVGSE